MSYQHIRLPQHGEKVSIKDGKLAVPDHPILGFVEGDGIGADITSASLRVWDAAVARAYGGARKVHWCELYMGEKAAGIYQGDYFPAETLAALKDLVVSIKGPLTTPVGGGFRSLNVSLRQEMDLYACVRPVRYFPGVPSPLRRPEEVDVVIFRENTEDVYAGIEYPSGSEDNQKLARFLREELHAEFFEDAGLGVKPVSSFASKRLIRKAIEYAIERGRASVTLVHKGNIMKFTEGAFRNWGYEVATEEFREHVGQPVFAAVFRRHDVGLYRLAGSVGIDQRCVRGGAGRQNRHLRFRPPDAERDHRLHQRLRRRAGRQNQRRRLSARALRPSQTQRTTPNRDRCAEYLQPPPAAAVFTPCRMPDNSADGKARESAPMLSVVNGAGKRTTGTPGHCRAWRRLIPLSGNRFCGFPVIA